MNDHGILDTNAVILLTRIADPECLPKYPAITTITLAELSVGPHVTTNNIERAARQAHLQQAESDFEPIPFDAAAARAFGRVASDLRSVGRKTKARAYDALIASIAVAQQMPLYSANPDDFLGITELELVPIVIPER